MSDLDAVRRFALSPDNGMMYEAERGGWVRHGDVAATIERLTAELAAAREPLTDEQIDAVTDQQWPGNINKPIYAAHRAYARAIERAIRASGR